MNTLSILPAIDLKNGQCVRLLQGRADAVTVYSSDPAEMARHWEQQGGDYLHVVDLDGAFQGHPVHLDEIRRIAEALSIPFEVGGGIRTDADIEQLLALGADRVILGTRACDSPETLDHLVQRYGARLAVGIDARDGLVQVKGWTETTGNRATELAARISALGVQTLIYTDTARDGMLHGVNTEAMAAICAAVDCRVIASGGVSTPEDIRALKALDLSNLTGAIVGKALYEQRVTVAQMKEFA
jgi:phosphoribosylformimino-5-aminoimidazole carboxamide ribotide isomerase